MSGTDRYAYASRLRRVEPGAKLALAGVSALVCLCCPGLLPGAVTWLFLSALCVGLGGIRLGRLLRLYAVPLAFLLLGSIAIALERADLGTPMLLAVELGGSLWGMAPGAPARLGAILCRAMGVIAAMYFLALNTPVTDLCQALRRLHLPGLLVELMELVYRFVFVLAGEAGRIHTAQASRLGYAGVRRSLNSLGDLSAAVFLRAWRRGDRVYAALESRGYTGALGTLPGKYTSGRALWLWAAGVTAAQLGAVWLERGLLR